MSIQSQAEFWRRNVCEVSEEAAASVPDGDMLDGMRAFSELLREIYSNYALFEVSKAESVMTKIGILADDLENYHNLTNMGKCLFELAKAGELCRNGAEYFLRVDKALFKGGFKKPPAPFFKWLEHFGFYLLYFKNGGAAKSYSGCDCMELYYENHPALLRAAEYLVRGAAEYNDKAAVMPFETAFLLADYDILCMGGGANKTVYELPQTIMNCAGDKGAFLAALAGEFCGADKLGIDFVINTYVFPNWTVKFRQGKRTIVTFYVKANCITVHLPLSYDAAKRVIDEKAAFTDGVSASLSRFGCAGCGKCSSAANLTEYKGYSVCSLAFRNFTTEYSRLIRMDIETSEDAAAIRRIVEISLQI
jgi:hypothetical protein